MLDFSNTTTKQGLIQRCELFTGHSDAGISGDSTKLAQFTGLLNDEYAAFVAAAIEADGRWQYDDTNHTRQPIATFDLVKDQAAYNFTLDQDSNQILRLAYITAKDSNGNWIDLTPMDLSQFSGSGIAYDEFQDVSSTPRYFDISDGTGVKLSPAPSYNSTGGGKVYFQREPSYFLSTDTTKKPGLPGIFHVGLAYGASAVYLLSTQDPRATGYFQKRDRVLEELKEFYSRRNRFEQPRMVGQRISSR